MYLVDKEHLTIMAKLYQQYELNLDTPFQASQRVPHTEYVKLINQGQTLTGDNLFGFKLGQLYSVKNVGMFTSILKNQPVFSTLYPALQHHFNQAGGHGIIHSLNSKGNIARHYLDYKFSDSVDCQQQFLTALTAYYASTVQAYDFNNPLKRLHIQNDNLTGKDLRQLEDYFNCPVILDEQTFAEFDASELHQPVSFSQTLDKDVEKASTKALVNSLRKMRDFPDYVYQLVKTLSLYQLNDDKTSIAKIIGCKPWILQEELSKAGTSLRDIQQRVKQEQGQYLLAHTDFSVLDIAQMLGYDSASVFIRQFKRWYGVTPLSFRKQVLKH